MVTPGQGCTPKRASGVTVGVALPVPPLVAVLFGPGVLLVPEAVPQATSVGIRKSNTRRLVPVNRRLEYGDAVCIMTYPSIDQDRHLEETF